MKELALLALLAGCIRRDVCENVAPTAQAAGAVALPSELHKISSYWIRLGPEVEMHFRGCGMPGSVVDAESWASALSDDGFIVQTADGGWVSPGPMAVRFRKGDLVGDVYGAQDAKGCRGYVVRMQFLRGRAASWQRPFGGGGGVGRCIRFFSADARFPFAERDYSWNCE